MVEAVLWGRRRKTTDRMAGAALRYATLGWPVCVGAFPAAAAQHWPDRQRACSCDRVGCPAPGAHPVSPAWQNAASTDRERIARWWLAIPEANVILVTGRVFDVLEVPARLGMTALARMDEAGLGLGPVAIAGDRAHFYVRTRGAPADENEWWSCHLDSEPEKVAEVTGLRWHCRDSYVLAPPSMAGDGTAGRWIRDPADRQLPDGVPLLEVLADVCEEAG